MLKNNTKSDDDLCKIAVAPFAGAWIETANDGTYKWIDKVAPFAGAWIETIPSARPSLKNCRRSFRRSVD